MDSLEDYNWSIVAMAHRRSPWSCRLVESNNEYWLQLDARLRTDFNIHRRRAEKVNEIRSKVDMKQVYLRAGVPVRQTDQDHDPGGGAGVRCPGSATRSS